MSTLTESIKDQLNLLAQQGLEEEEAGNMVSAAACFEKGLSLIPEPQKDYPESLWFQISLGDIYFLQNEYEKSAAFFAAACENKTESETPHPFVMLRLGQCMYQMKKPDEALAFFTRVWQLSGPDAFQDEDDCYLNFLQSRLQNPSL